MLVGYADFSALECLTSTRQNRLVIYVLAYPELERRSAERVSTFRATHEPERARLVPPHVTLVFGVANEYLGEVTGLVDTVSHQIEAFPILFDDCVIEFDPFEKTYKLFLLCGEGSEQISALHNQLYQGRHRSELSSAHPFKPHMTIATYKELADLEKVDFSAIGELPIRGNLSAMALVQLEDGCLTTLKTAPLIA